MLHKLRHKIDEAVKKQVNKDESESKKRRTGVVSTAKENFMDGNSQEEDALGHQVIDLDEVNKGFEQEDGRDMNNV